MPGEFLYTSIPLVPDTKHPAKHDGFPLNAAGSIEYDLAVYGYDYRRGDFRQAGHVTSCSSRLMVIDVDDPELFLGSSLARYLLSVPDVGERLSTYRNASLNGKLHVYVVDHGCFLDDAEWPVTANIGSTAGYDLRTNGFVRAEPAYEPTGNPPIETYELDWAAFEEAVKADREAFRAATRKARPEKQPEFMTGELRWDHWHHDDGSVVKGFTDSFADAQSMAGQLRNWYENYDDALAEFMTAILYTPGYAKKETWEETFERMWFSMPPAGGKSAQQRQREQREFIERGLNMDGSDAAWGRFEQEKVSEAEARYRDAQEADRLFRDRFEVPVPVSPDVVQEAVAAGEEQEVFQYEPGPGAPATAGPAPQPDIFQIPGVRNYFERKLAEELYEQRERERAQSDWTARGGFRDDLMELDDPPPPTMLAIKGHSDFPFLIVENSVTVLFGARGGGKTWTAATWAEQEIRRGNHVVWLDFERQDRLMKMKLDTLRVQKHLAKAQFHYSDNGLPPIDYIAARISAWREASANKRVLVVVDSFRDLLNSAVPDGDSNSGETVAKVYDVFLNKLHKAGATLCLIDHEAKTGTGSAFGSERKESAADFVLQVEQKIAFTQKRSGYATIHVKKDRYGHVPGNQDATEVGYLWVPGTDDGRSLGYPDRPEIRSDVPGTAADAEKKVVSNDFKVRRVESVVGYLIANGGLSGLVRESALNIAGKLLVDDAPLEPEERSWVNITGKDKGKALSVESVATKIGNFATGKDIPEGYTYPSKVRRDVSGAFYLETAADRHEDTGGKPDRSNWE